MKDLDNRSSNPQPRDQPHRAWAAALGALSLALTIHPLGAQTAVPLQRADHLMPFTGTPAGDACKNAGHETKFPRNTEYKDVQLAPLAPGGRLALYLPNTRPGGGDSGEWIESLLVWNTALGHFCDEGPERLGFSVGQNRDTYDADFIDVDGDGDYDIVHTSPHGSRLFINVGGTFQDQSSQRFPTLLTQDNTNVWDDVVAGDIDADGDLDLAFSNRTFGGIPSHRGWGPSMVLYNDGQGFFNRAPLNYELLGEPSQDVAGELESSSHGIKIADVNNDGRLDLVVSHLASYTSLSGSPPWIEVLLNQGDPDGDGLVNWNQAWTLSSGGSVVNVGVLDFDNDGDLDLYLAQGGRDRLFLGDGTGSFSNSGIEVPRPEESYDVAFGDINDDGFMDAATPAADGTNVRRALYLNDGGTDLTISNDTLLNTSPEFQLSVAFADIDDDGDLDLAWGADSRDAGTPLPTIFLNTSGSQADSRPPVLEHPKVVMTTAGEPSATFRVRIRDRLLDIDEISASFAWTAARSDGSNRSGTAPLSWATAMTYQARIACSDLRDGLGESDTVTALTGQVTATDSQNNSDILNVVASDNLANALASATGTGLSVDILEPLESKPAPVQPSDGSGRLLVRVAYRPLNLEPSHEDFVVRIGGSLAQVVEGERVGNEMWLAVVPPAGVLAASTLEVSYRLCEVLVSDVEFNSVFFGNPREADTAIVIDTSGSMKHDRKMESAINAGKVIVYTQRDGERISVSEYSGELNNGYGRAATPYSMRLVNETVRGEARAQIEGLLPNGSTPLGAGLLEGLGQLDSVPGAQRNDVRAIVLLSDGLENVPNYWEDPPVAASVSEPTNTPVKVTFDLPENQAIIIHTISLGPESDPELMQRIAADTGGIPRRVDLDESPENASFFNLVQPHGVRLAAASPSVTLESLTLHHRLANTFEHIHNDVSFQQRLWQGIYVVKGLNCEPIPVIARQTVERQDRIELASRERGASDWRGNAQWAQKSTDCEAVTVPIEPGLDHATLTLNWIQPGGMQLDLIPPPGPGSAGVISRSNADNTTVFRIQGPRAGEWRVSIQGRQGEKLMLVLSGESSERGFLRPVLGTETHQLGILTVEGPRLLPPGSTVPMGLVLFGQLPVTGAQVVATVRSVAHGVETFALRDHGLGLDATANDGIYTGSFSDTILGGAFAVEAMARWTGADGVARERIFTTSVVLQSLDSDGDTISNEDEDRKNGLPDPLDPNDPTDVAEDPDGDGLVNWKECELGTDPTDADSDGGGAGDGLEVCLRLDPENPDDDFKALVDADGDGLPDRWEAIHGPQAGDPAADPDGDGLTNAEELRWCSDPLEADTDGDHVVDGEEVDQGRDPTDPKDRGHPKTPTDCPEPCCAHHSSHDGCRSDCNSDCNSGCHADCHGGGPPNGGIPPGPVGGGDDKPHGKDGDDRFALSVHLGYPQPLFDFDDSGASGDVSGEVDFEWRFAPLRSLEVVRGRYNFEVRPTVEDPVWVDTEIDGLTAYYKRYLAPVGSPRVFWQVGPGAFDVERGLSTFGLSGGVGWQVPLASPLEFEAAAMLFHLFARGGQDAIDFALAKVGFKLTF